MSRAIPTRLLLFCGVLGPLVFVLVFLVEGALRPGYDAWRTTISTLSWGPRGWIQIADFEVFGVLMLGFAVGVRPALRGGSAAWSAPVLFAVMGLGLITAGMFATDPILGYPPGYSDAAPPTLHGTIHNLASLIVFVGCAIACFVVGARFVRQPGARGWALYSILSGVLILGSMVWFFAGVSADIRGSAVKGLPPGLRERLLSVVGCLWTMLLALRLARAPI